MPTKRHNVDWPQVQEYRAVKILPGDSLDARETQGAG